MPTLIYNGPPMTIRQTQTDPISFVVVGDPRPWPKKDIR